MVIRLKEHFQETKISIFSAVLRNHQEGSSRRDVSPLRTIHGDPLDIGCLRAVETTDVYATGRTLSVNGATSASTTMELGIARGNHAMNICDVSKFRPEMTMEQLLARMRGTRAFGNGAATVRYGAVGVQIFATFAVATLFVIGV